MNRFLRSIVLFGLICGFVPIPAAWAQKPASKTHLGSKASVLVKLAVSGPAEDTRELTQRLPDGTIVPGPISIPDGTLFVLTDVDCERVGTATTGDLAVTFRMPTTTEVIGSCRWNTALEGHRISRSWTTGELLSEFPQVEFSASNSGTVRVRLRGYYVKDK